MAVSPARWLAYRILRHVESGRVFAVDLLQRQEVSDLKVADRRLGTELIMGVLRWGRALDHEVELLAGRATRRFDPEVLTILRLGVYQVYFLRKTPKSAVVDDAVQLTKMARKRSAAGLVNALLRKCQPPAEPIPRIQEGSSQGIEMACRSMPPWLLERWTSRFGDAAAKALAWRSTLTPSTTLRVPAADRDAIERQLAENGIRARSGAYSPLALAVESSDAQRLKAFRQDGWVIQDEASQLVARLLDVKPGVSVLDVCAAPGIKTGQLIAALGRGSLVAADFSARRLATMGRLLAIPPGVRLYRVRLNATRELPFSRRFDRILVDAPCSGTGTLGRNPEIKWRLEADDLTRLANLQRLILSHALEVLAPGGRLVYATCSLEPEENEGVVEWVLPNNPEYRRLGPDEFESSAFGSLVDSQGYFRTRPDLHSLDGLFAAIIVRAL
jgi:16S rRNA (cytosine967-C5)-methyltransferase